MSGIALQMAFPSYHRLNLHNNHKGLEALALLQSVLLFAFALALFIDVKSFGSSPECNIDATITILFPILVVEAGRIIWLIIIIGALIIYVLMTLNDYIPNQKRRGWLWKIQSGRGIKLSRNVAPSEVGKETYSKVEDGDIEHPLTLIESKVT